MNKKFMDFLKNKNNRIILIILIIGTLFMLVPGREKKQPEPAAAEEKLDESERLCEMLSMIKGAGDVEVMVTYSGTEEKRLAYETKSGKTDRGDSGYEENLDKQAIMADGEPVILSKSYPKVKGVVVIAEGAGDSKVKAAITEAVMTALDIAPHKVCILEK